VPLLFDGVSSRVTWFTLPLVLWLIVFAVRRLTRAGRPLWPVWRWTFVAVVAWMVAGMLVHFLGLRLLGS
jgi:hypothetical protein